MEGLLEGESPYDASCESVNQAHSSRNENETSRKGTKGGNAKMESVQKREYQMELLEIAKRENIIVFLPTGSGKTFIALKLTEHMLAKNFGLSKKVFFVANTVPLVHQQAEVFAQNLPNGCRVVPLTSKVNATFSNKKQWEKQLANADVFVLSTMILYNAITAGFVKWKEISLLILDECHHAKGNDPMGKLMDLYKEQLIGQQEVPKVLGLTATICMGSVSCSNLTSEIDDIQQRLSCRAVTHSDSEEVSKYSASASMQLLYHSDSDTYKQADTACSELLDALDILRTDGLLGNIGTSRRKQDQQKLLEKMLMDVLAIYEELGPYCASLAAHINMASIWEKELEYDLNGNSDQQPQEGEMVEMFLSSGTVGLNESVIMGFVRTQLSIFHTNLQIIMKKSFEAQSGVADFKKFAVETFITEKVSELIRFLLLKRPFNMISALNEPICGIIFCERRVTVQVLHLYLKDKIHVDPPELNFIHPDFLLGSNGNTYDELNARQATRRQSQVLNKFRNGEINLIVSTNVLEEGLDVPLCNMVVKFDGVKTYPSFIQSMGRARKKNAQFFVFLKEGEREKETKKIEEYIKFNAELARVLRKRVEHVGEDLLLQIPEATEIPNFCPGGGKDGKGILTAACAIERIHRYCNTLSPASGIPAGPVSWATMEPKKKFQGHLALPNNAVVNHVIHGPLMATKVNAKRAVYMEACKLLYQAGELDEHFLPVGSDPDNQLEWNFFEDLLQEDVSAKRDGKMVAGKTRSQWYSKTMPISVLAETIVPALRIRMYAIRLQYVNFHYAGDRFSSSYCNDFSNHPHSFTLLTAVDFSSLPPFLLHSKYGDIEVTLEPCPDVCFTKEELEQLILFQSVMCETVYGIIIGNFLQPTAKCDLLVAPTKAGVKPISVDWELINKLVLVFNGGNLAFMYRQKEFRFDPNMYKDAVVVPCVPDGKEAYLPTETINVVEEVSSNLTAESPVDFNYCALSFKSYFENKWKVSVFHPDVPLLLCKTMGKQRNFLSKKHAELCGKIKEKNITKYVPELMCIHPVPASIFLQGRFLPSVIHRINRLFLALCLRRHVASKFQWDVEDNDTSKQKTEEQVVILDNRSGTAGRENTESNLETINGACSSQFPSLDARTDFTVEKGPSTFAIMEALTLARSGDKIDLEKLEVIGDAVLKYIVSVHIYCNFSTWSDGKMTTLRTKLISNEHLYLIGKRRLMGEHLSGCIFSPETWLPPGLDLAESLKNKSGESMPMTRTTMLDTNMTDKDIADCIEALIGAYFLNGGLDSALRLMTWVGLEGPLPDKTTKPYSRNTSFRKTPSTTSELNVHPLHPHNFSPYMGTLEETISYSFKNKWLLLEALTHPSSLENRVTGSYQRLEFLGDAVLDFLITNYIFTNTSIQDPGLVTDLRSALVNNVTLGMLSVRYEFYKYLLHGSEILHEQMNAFNDLQDNKNHQISEGYTVIYENGIAIAKDTEVSKVLGDLFESIVGAIFIDSGLSLDVVWKVVYPLMKNEIDEFSKNIPRDPIRSLHEVYPGRVQIEDVHVVVNSTSQVIKISIVGTNIRAFGEGRNKKQAKRAAAKFILKTYANTSNSN